MQPPTAGDATHNNPFNVSLWMLYKRWFNDETHTDWLEKMCDYDFFLWASQFAHKYMEHKDKEGFYGALLKKLIELSQLHLASDGLDTLWSHSFAHLMKLGREALSYEVAFKVTHKYFPPLSEWDDKVQALCQLIHGHCTPDKLHQLAEDDFFWEQLGSYLNSDRKFVENVVGMMFKVCDKGDLTEATQVQLLTRPLALPTDIHSAYAYKLERGIKKVRGDGKEVAENWDRKETPFYKELKQIEQNLFLSQDD
eukprot:NODE_1465_length_1324_cov_104.483709_g1452_i0.p1 GENE.NODE_1465_length_1324_cov_104.483709_g1452_i0~~NODE_1465_length_1324_cov_104.483709_g1452_i0.p1  ORF type:complete len:253 (+),score=76.25 NODE_1465_length_1324_cov_104.483709_g1452_i0:488-1246(+)